MSYEEKRNLLEKRLRLEAIKKLQEAALFFAIQYTKHVNRRGHKIH